MANAAHKVRKERANRDAFAALIATPAVAPFALPANARLAFRAVGVKLAGVAVATLEGPTTRNIVSPAMVSGELLVVDRAERGAVVTVAAGFEALVDTGLGRWSQIG